MQNSQQSLSNLRKKTDLHIKSSNFRVNCDKTQLLFLFSTNLPGNRTCLILSEQSVNGSNSTKFTPKFIFLLKAPEHRQILGAQMHPTHPAPLTLLFLMQQASKILKVTFLMGAQNQNYFSMRVCLVFPSYSFPIQTSLFFLSGKSKLCPYFMSVKCLNCFSSVVSK